MLLESIYFLLGSNPFNAVELLRGVAEVASIGGIRVFPVQSPESFGDPRGSGLLVTPRPDVVEQFPEWVRRWDGRVVGLFDHDFPEGMGAVVPDEAAIGALAAEHLLERGYRRLAFYGPDLMWSRLRAEGFAAYAAGRGVGVDVLVLGGTWEELRSPGNLVRCLSGAGVGALGVLAANDQLGADLREASLGMGLRIPEEVGLVAVDNYEIVCAYGSIPISSVDVGARRLGAAAARMLLARSAREGGFDGVTLDRIPPTRVVARRSTDALVVGDEMVSAVLRAVREDEGMSQDADAVAGRVGVSRATMDRRLKRAIGRSFTEEVLHQRLLRARRLMETTSLSLGEIAGACGFHYLSHLSHAFKKAFGTAPNHWRQARRGESGLRGTGVGARASGAGSGL